MPMDIHYPTLDEPATAEYVLAVLRDQHRLLCEIDEGDPGVSLSFETTVTEWICAGDLLGTRQLGRALNDGWDLDYSDAEWHRVLEPSNQRQLAGACRLIAAKAARPRIRPALLFGCTCGSAGAFLTVRSLLHEAGANATEVAPSTPLAPFACRYLGVFLGPISRLAPGALPPARIHDPIRNTAACCLLAGIFGMLVGGFSGLVAFQVGGSLLAAISALVVYWSKPSAVEFGELRTFRDLARLIAESAPP
jgi:hypothetical protein